MPDYDTIEIMREKFLIAIEMVGEIDDDGGAGGANQGEVEMGEAEDRPEQQ